MIAGAVAIALGVVYGGAKHHGTGGRAAQVCGIVYMHGRCVWLVGKEARRVGR